MLTRNARLYSIALIIGDFLTLLAAFTLAYIVRVQVDGRPLVAEIKGVEFIQTALILIPFWILAFATLGLYDSKIYSRRLTEIGRLFIGSVIGILIVLGYAFIIDEPVFPARLVAVYAFAGSFLLLVIAREIIRQVRTLLFRYGRGVSRVLIIGTTDAVSDIASQLNDTRKSGYHVVAIAGPKRIVPKNFKGHHYGNFEQALDSLKQLRVTTIVQTDLYDSSDRNQQILSAAQSQHIAYNFIPGEPEFYSGKNTVDVFLGYPVITVHQTPLVGWGEVVKRMFDITVTSIILLLLSPLILLLIILQKLLNPGPVFFKHKRLTRYSTPFGMLKFRSMQPQFGPKDAVQDFIDMGLPDLAEEYRINRKILSRPDPRITPFGHFLRKTSLDELPQFFNVLKGDLSLVGPRPIEPIELPNYHGRGSLLLSVKSGITGLWQVSGRNDLSFDKRVELELYYAQNWSFWLDIKILLKTPGALLKRRGVPGANDKK